MEKNLSKKSVDFLKSCFEEDILVVLESQLPGHPSSRCSYFAARPCRLIQAYGTRIIQKENGVTTEFEMNPWLALEQFQNRKPGWLFGYLGYDLKNYLEEVHSANPDPLNTPDLFFMEPSVLYKIEESGEIRALTGEAVNVLPEVVIAEAAETGTVTPAIDRQTYIENVRSIKAHIAEGDFYEMNYSYPLTGTYTGNPYQLYKQMREINPVPFGGFIQTGEISVCCSSPERFLQKKGSLIRSEPIKGTAPRSRIAAEDLQHKKLLLNEKNRAENLMIVDLVRHDLSRIAKTGTVKVAKLFDIQSFGTVHQLTSTVEAEARAGLSPIEIIKNCFPMGSMTGAPKIEVMRAIDRIEMYKRGIYSGAMGYFTPGGDFDLNVIIRTAILQNQNLIYPVGGAITSDSDPGNEWEETGIKARNLTNVFFQNMIV